MWNVFILTLGQTDVILSYFLLKSIPFHPQGLVLQ